MNSTRDRVLGCLRGIAIGDAIGKQTENLSHEEVERWYPNSVRGFEGNAGTAIPRYVGNRKHEWVVGETTDDTERTLAVARAILRHEKVDHTSVGAELLTCHKSVHPGVKSLWEFHQLNDPSRVTDRHDGCGAAIRVAPVGVVHRPSCLEQIVSDAREASISTHGGPLALAAAAATAAAVSAAIEGWTPSEMVALAVEAANRAETARCGAPSHMFGSALRHLHERLVSCGELEPTELARSYFPNKPLVVVPLALALAATMGSAQRAILFAANVGGDSDSVASIAGGILGARYPKSVNPRWVEVVEAINGHQLVPIAAGLTSLRHQSSRK